MASSSRGYVNALRQPRVSKQPESLRHGHPERETTNNGPQNRRESAANRSGTAKKTHASQINVDDNSKSKKKRKKKQDHRMVYTLGNVMEVSSLFSKPKGKKKKNVMLKRDNGNAAVESTTPAARSPPTESIVVANNKKDMEFPPLAALQAKNAPVAVLKKQEASNIVPSNTTTKAVPPKHKNKQQPEKQKQQKAKPLKHPSSPIKSQPFVMKLQEQAPPRDGTDLMELWQGQQGQEFTKGRQRIRPRKKKFTTLKKRVLQERLAQWKAANPSFASNDDMAKKETNTVALYGFATLEELQDPDEYEELLSNARDMAGKVGPVDKIEFDTTSLRVSCLITFQTSTDAQAACACWDKLRLGGQVLEASMGENETSNGTPLMKDNDESTIVLSNVLTQDDLEDEDSLKESLEDIQNMAQSFGIDVHQVEPRNDQVLIHMAGDASLALHKFSGMVIGGQSVVATIEGNGSPCWIALRNILTQDDLQDEDCLEETKHDIFELAGNHGKVLALEVGGDVARVQYDCEESATAAAESLDGTVIGGLAISASVWNEASKYDVPPQAATDSTKESSAPAQEEPKPMFSGDKRIPERFAECKRVPKMPHEGTRHYATPANNPEVKVLLKEMLGELMRLQKRAQQEKNAKARRRLVMGLREVARGIRAHKVKMVVMANNLDDQYGAIDETLQSILELAQQEGVPVFFEFSKRALGKALGKSIKIAIAGIQNADGSHQQFKKLMALSR